MWECSPLAGNAHWLDIISYSIILFNTIWSKKNNIYGTVRQAVFEISGFPHSSIRLGLGCPKCAWRPSEHAFLERPLAHLWATTAITALNCPLWICCAAADSDILLHLSFQDAQYDYLLHPIKSMRTITGRSLISLLSTCLMLL